MNTRLQRKLSVCIALFLIVLFFSSCSIGSTNPSSDGISDDTPSVLAPIGDEEHSGNVSDETAPVSTSISDEEYDAYRSCTEYYPLWAQPFTQIIYDTDKNPTIIEGGFLEREDFTGREDIQAVGYLSSEDDMRIEPNTKAEYDLHGFIQNIYYEKPDAPGEYQLSPPMVTEQD